MHIDQQMAEYDFTKQVVIFCQNNNINLVVKHEENKLKFFDNDNEITSLNFIEYKKEIGRKNETV